jgi:hypothetical protein
MNKFTAACKWLDLGALLLPCKPYKKDLLFGYGENQKQVNTKQFASQMFGAGSRYNLAVLFPHETNLICLDFDNLDVFHKWDELVPIEVEFSYTEISRRGWHVFYRCEVPPGLRLIPGVEIKRRVLVAPSERHDPYMPHFIYQAVDEKSPILTVKAWQEILAPLLTPDQEQTKEPTKEKLVSVSPPAGSAERWLVKALERAHPGNRNNTGAWLLRQCRDDGVPLDVAIALRYPERVAQGDHPYTRQEFESTARSVYSQPAREPARRRP